MCNHVLKNSANMSLRRYNMCLGGDPRGIPSTGVDQDQVEGTLEAHGMHPARKTQRIRTPIGGRVARSAGVGQGRRTLFLLGGLIPMSRVLGTSMSVRCVRTLRGMPFTRVRRTRAQDYVQGTSYKTTGFDACTRIRTTQRDRLQKPFVHRASPRREKQKRSRTYDWPSLARPRHMQM